MHGYIGSCQQADITGWAVDDEGNPALLTIEINGEVVAQLQCNIPRPDVAAAGFAENSGFVCRFPRPVGASDVEVAVKVNGRHIGNSPSFHHAQRVQRLGYEISRTDPGLELGALAWPFLPKPHYNVLYVDHASTQDLLKKYAGHGVEHMVETDIVWSPGVPMATATSEKFHYAVASQVFEHVADPIGWLGDIASSLIVGGRINLSVPDKRRTFDIDRTLSSAADMIWAHEQRLRQPNFLQVLDFLLGTRPKTVEHYRECYRLARTADTNYIDTHCHVWTYESFPEAWDIIERLYFVPVRLDKSWPPIEGSNEFILSFVVER